MEQLKRNSSAARPQRPVTLRDVEDGAVNLRKVGEKLATLKGERDASSKAEDDLCCGEGFKCGLKINEKRDLIKWPMTDYWMSVMASGT